ncbi:MAG: hypothetical protein ACREJW_00075 [Candidatus Methylomirabilales bacterium]
MTDLPAPKVILMGLPGSGKTWSLHTALRSGLEVFLIGTEPNAIDSILDACQATGTSTEHLHWTTIRAAPADRRTLRELVKITNLMSYEDITKIKGGVARQRTGQLAKLVDVLEDFKCEHCGAAFGDPAKWPDTRMLVLDSLSGLNHLAMTNHIGLKPSAHLGEWGCAINTEAQFINDLVYGLQCYFTLIAHIDRDTNQITGGTVISPAALGNKYGPKMGKDFSEVILAKKQHSTFVWSTSESDTATKNRSLPINDKLPPSFAPIIAAHNNRKKLTAPQPSVTSITPKPAA